MPEDGAEATFAPGQDLSLESTEMLLEDMASTMWGADINKIFQLHYDVIEFGEWKSQLIDCKSLDFTKIKGNIKYIEYHASGVCRKPL